MIVRDRNRAEQGPFEADDLPGLLKRLPWVRRFLESTEGALLDVSDDRGECLARIVVLAPRTDRIYGARLIRGAYVIVAKVAPDGTVVQAQAAGACRLDALVDLDARCYAMLESDR